MRNGESRQLRKNSLQRIFINGLEAFARKHEQRSVESVANASQAMEGVASAKDAVEPNPLGRLNV
ncbi:hypothetical protein LEP1GSC047_4401 [Leptospira inadai serovar Lyme str. 10]|uniref:Uncharacterized protein n=2 Tax=Leptospira inadai serovar Lyme TaxID=293084 RepID=V6HDB4_9LEPT|nr:hypothetical protein [Leptospira inadai]EQA38076.1 hypothetical protein LEP1GSC047_4401 [Leptospira inadai serovar Lyme str. 10]PNV72077.1 hypothetical protein BES34_020225 [Leptospira inadai serovar Lyme]